MAVSFAAACVSRARVAYEERAQDMIEEKTPRLKPEPFERASFASGAPFMRIGTGEYGGKACGLLDAFSVLEWDTENISEMGIRIDIPATVVVATDIFEAFMTRNDLYEVALSGAPDDRIAHAFQQADFPGEHVGDLLAIVNEMHLRPLAIRSSSLLEDALNHPFAGVFKTKMIPNNHSDPGTRFKRLVEAIKFVYASTFFRSATDYMKAIDVDPREERMAVLIQEVVGTKRNSRFYPEVSGVCKSFNYYRMGAARPEDGVVSLALGLGKTIVDGGVSWSYSPAYPKVNPAFSSVRDLLQNTQLDFWSVHLGTPPAHDPIRETEYMVQPKLQDAEYDGALTHVASTYDASSDRFMPGVRSVGPRVVDFAPILKFTPSPFNDALKNLLDIFENATASPVEIEFAATLEKSGTQNIRLAVLQVRPMMVSRQLVELSVTDQQDSRVLVYSELVMGNGTVDGLTDIVYVKPGVFDRAITPQIACEVESFNRQLSDEGKRYLLIGFGRWGSSERWLGIPVTWGQISAAAVIVESSLPEINVDLSQGSHFFHNIESFEVSYFCVRHESDPPIDWRWLSQQQLVGESETVRHVRTESPVLVKVDGRYGRGIILHD